MKKTKVIGIIILLLVICLVGLLLFIAEITFFRKDNDKGITNTNNLAIVNNTNSNNTQSDNTNELLDYNDLNFWRTER